MCTLPARRLRCTTSGSPVLRPSARHRRRYVRGDRARCPRTELQTQEREYRGKVSGARVIQQDSGIAAAVQPVRAGLRVAFGDGRIVINAEERPVGQHLRRYNRPEGLKEVCVAVDDDSGRAEGRDCVVQTREGEIRCVDQKIARSTAKGVRFHKEMKKNEHLNRQLSLI